MQYASHLRVQRLGEFMVGTELRHSESLALVQALLLYHLVSTRAAIGAGTRPSRAGRVGSRRRRLRAARLAGRVSRRAAASDCR